MTNFDFEIPDDISGLTHINVEDRNYDMSRINTLVFFVNIIENLGWGIVGGNPINMIYYGRCLFPKHVPTSEIKSLIIKFAEELCNVRQRHPMACMFRELSPTHVWDEFQTDMFDTLLPIINGDIS